MSPSLIRLARPRSQSRPPTSALLLSSSTASRTSNLTALQSSSPVLVSSCLPGHARSSPLSSPAPSITEVAAGRACRWLSRLSLRQVIPCLHQTVISLDVPPGLEHILWRPSLCNIIARLRYVDDSIAFPLLPLRGRLPLTQQAVGSAPPHITQDLRLPARQGTCLPSSKHCPLADTCIAESHHRFLFLGLFPRPRPSLAQK